MEPLGWSGPDATGILSPVLDAEAERYRLLAYMQRVEAHFQARELYPWLEEIHARTEQLNALVRRTEELDLRMPSELQGLDMERAHLVREPVPAGRMAEVRNGLQQALGHLNRALDHGQELLEDCQSTIRCEPVGLLPIGAHEGWLLLRQGQEAVAYAYALPLVRSMETPFTAHRCIRTKYYSTFTVGLAMNYERIKQELTRTGPFPNPAVFAFESTVALPRIETFLPLAKRIAYGRATASGR
jgi:hypothetical protein